MPSIEHLSGWGNYNKRQCLVQFMSGSVALKNWVTENRDAFIARGYGRSYGDAAVNSYGHVLKQCYRNRFLKFDEESGKLICEAGVSLSEIITVFLPRGWFLPTTPGTKFVSVGGAIAADVHGKNHHVDGSWGTFVHSFELLLPNGEVKHCSRIENKDLFRSTIGGMGLTGIILTAEIQLVPVEAAWVKVDYKRTKDLNDTFATFAEDAAKYRYSVAWIDCVSKGKNMGRSVCMFGNDTDRNEVPDLYRRKPLSVPTKRKKTVLFDFPNWVLNPFSTKVFNSIYYDSNRNCTKVVDYDSFFYPLDSILNWNRIYGKRGFVQYQAFLPPNNAERGYRRILERITNAGFASFLAVFKSCGPGREGLLSFLDEGYTLALDLPNTGENLRALSNELDKIVVKNEGRLYLAKDALTDSTSFAEMYPQLPEFKEIKNRIDPRNQIISEQARRLKIVEGV
ncbi:FAD-linked oxidase [Desulfosarcina ovata subsp. sediminis]|uniref:FAD-linked oxidase n=1 Tax=Desulfosarcina ovata subsp. sediminis TaxID=885957 RepID=A0A5K7ZNN6_9BACT|nr:FAD-binding oxidoreductase [Desulfosarcina ovata]BBO81289.1 FAD-linked oxidase [Desulfosarcina ovata subsp. sediminis]